MAAIGSGAVAGVLFAVYTWPWVLHPGEMGVRDGDAYLHSWSMAWVARWMLGGPDPLYAANMFFPHQAALVFTETLFPQSVLAAFVIALGGSPLLALNLAVGLSFVLCAAFAAALSFRLTRCSVSSVVAGLVYALAGFRFAHLSQIGVLWSQWFPLALCALHEIALRGRTRSRRALVTLFAAGVLQCLSSGYHALVLLVPFAVTLVVLGPRFLRLKRFAGVSLTMIAIYAIAALVTSRVSRADALGGLTRGVEERVHWSAVPRSYLEPAPRASWNPVESYRRLIEPTTEALFAGFIPTGLALFGLIRAFRSTLGRWTIATGVLGIVFSFGPRLRDLPLDLPGPYAIVQTLPGFALLRAPSRFGVLGLLAIAVLASMGCRRLLRYVPARRRSFAGVILIGTLAVELAPSVRIGSIDEPSAAHRYLAHAPRGAVLELPWRYEADAGEYLYWSVVNWQPMINGYGGFAPQGNFALAARAQAFPSQRTVDLLRCHNVRYVLLHLNRVGEVQRARAIEGSVSGQRLLVRSGDNALFELKDGPPASCDSQHE